MLKKTALNIRLFIALLRRLLLKPLGKFVLIPTLMAIIGIVVVGRITDWWKSPDSYYIYLVGDHVNNSAIAEIFKGFRDEKACDRGDVTLREEGIDGVSAIMVKGVPIKVKCVDDQGDLAEVRRISADLAQRNDTLMVIGHAYSTSSKEALPNYLLQAQPAIPVILTTETNPHLIPSKNSDGDYRPVFRLWPTDDEQATKFAQFVLDNRNQTNGSQVFWVVEDEQNPTYSKYLALEFIKKVQENKGQVVLWSTNMSVPPGETLNQLKINSVFFAGDWQNALILIRQIKRIFPPNKLPTILLSDQAVDPQLLTYGTNELKELNVYLAHPLKAAQFKDSGFRLIGEDARLIIDMLLEDAHQHFAEESKARSRFKYWSMLLLNRRVVEDARAVLKSRMEKKAATDRLFKGALGKYQFSYYGRNMAAQWHIWQVKQAKKGDKDLQFVDVDQLTKPGQ